MKTRLTHVRANVSDLHKAIEWYESMLGFECTGADINERWAYADFECGEGATFAIMVSERGNSSARFNFLVDNVDELWKSLKDKVTILQPIETMPYGNRKFTIIDPDGNELGFVQEKYVEGK
ncbi:MAG TPA: bleomycin resistance protein [Lachnoclostridium phytofermentans]|uniref:Bleomycin resistance protein n=1 Tax=Lachnoclostridium phytofermentans TaxID=66219 RepID=A0A3D2XAB4_9FIRM|nr:VOC family protein [Lachnoclostridium sp.]HCL03465.1 bleomycin resistance protein [Lachnoclostridium phytofermentans]